MKRSGIIFSLLISFIGGILWYGNSLPELSHNSVSQSFNKSDDYLWNIIYQYKLYPEWRETVYAVEITPSTADVEAWKEIDEYGNTTPFQVLELKKNVSVILQETGDSHTTSGKWTFDITKSDNGETTMVTITEDRLIPDIIPRVINHLLKTSSENIDAYFRSINNKIIRDEIRAKKAR